MKKLIILMLLIMLAIMTQAQETENYVIIEKLTNIYSGTNRRLAVRTVVPAGILTVTGKSEFHDEWICTGIYDHDRNMWLRVDVEGIEGWIQFCRVDFVGSVNDLPTAEPIAPLIRRPKRYIYYGIASGFRLDTLGDPPSHPYFVSNMRSGTVNLRELPSVESEIIEIATAEQVYVIGRNRDNTWLYVTYSGISPFDRDTWSQGSKVQIGWIAGYLLTKPDGWQDIVPIVES